MKIGHFQCESIAGDYAANRERLMAGLEQAAAAELAIVSFPESLLTGYFDDAEKARQHSFTIAGPEITSLLAATAAFDPTFMVGFNERRGDLLYNTVLVACRGELLGTYSKAFPVFDYFEPGREFPVFERDGMRFGVVICADGGYIEPTRILALKGAQVVFAPHYNYVAKNSVIDHFLVVRRDHAARAVENGVYFLRGNNFVSDRDGGIMRDGVGYGDSYLLDRKGEILVRSKPMSECLISAEIDPIKHGDTPIRNHFLAIAEAACRGQSSADSIGT
jgi:predicted amidohydrolase